MRHLFGKHLGTLSSHLGLWHKALQDRTLLNLARNRSIIAGGVFIMAFFIIVFRLFDLMIMKPGPGVMLAKRNSANDAVFARADIVDCKGRILATQVVTASVYANPQEIINVSSAANKLAELIPGLNKKKLKSKLESNKRFIWVARHVTPKLQHKIHRLGMPGVYLKQDEKRVYPMGNLTAHIVGFTGVDGQGLAGIERSFNNRLRVNSAPLALSLDAGVQHRLHRILADQIAKHRAKGGYALVIDLETREVRALVSLPDFDPHNLARATSDQLINRATMACYEHGSIMKAINTAIALECGGIKFSKLYDATKPIKVGRYLIKDFRGKNRILSVPEGFIYSSNIVMVKMAMDFGGGAVQRRFLRQLNMTVKPQLEVPELATPLVPSARRWGDSTTMTVSYGYGVSFSPMTVIDALSSLIKNGEYIPATIIKGGRKGVVPRKIMSSENSRRLRYLMRLVATHGTGRKANAPYDVIVKTGTANKAYTGGRRGYNMKERISSCFSAFPMENPRYVIHIGLDSPQPTKETYGYATGGWTAAPAVRRAIEEIAPMLGVAQIVDPEDETVLQRRNPAIKYIRMNHATR